MVFLIALGAPGASADTEERNFGSKYSPLDSIRKSNIDQLGLAWQFNTGDIPSDPGLTAFQDTPVLVGDNLIVCSVTRKVMALDPATGKKRWEYDPKSPKSSTNKCRGVSVWTDTLAQDGQQCKTRLLLGTSDYRLIAIDAVDGQPCQSFGEQGEVTIETSKPQFIPGEVAALSRPAVVNDVVVVGSSVMDNQRLDSPSGRVMAFSARTGEYLWNFDPIPRDGNNPAMKTWTKGKSVNGGGNVWSGMVVDEALDMVYLPTTSPSVDFYGGERPGDNLYTDSVVALKGSTGEVAWHFQVVHHDVWDYDLPTPGMLIDYPVDGQLVPALVQNTKQGLVFIFNRITGEPLVPIEERKVPQMGAVAGERLSPTQPFPVGMPAVSPQGFSLDDVWGFTPIDKWLCRREAEKLQTGPIYTPPSEQGTIYQPAPSGGPNWGGGAYDPASHIMVIASNTVPLIVSHKRREEVAATDGAEKGHADLSAGFTFTNTGSAYITTIKPFLSPLGAPCSAPPWAKLTAVDLVKKEIVWEVPLGSIEKLAPVPIPWELGTPGGGSPLMIGSGIAFIGFATDYQFRAIDVASGKTLWSHELPSPANSTPITYQYRGEQYVVVPAGGHSMWGTELGDAVVAFKLQPKS
ncbi:pyrroloquinoline quinone-dependent dehydrogenase [Aestuariicella hydrocarbonica]|uniref:Pyrroloquinoline quinone-dependent dehydrogenase n=1 Tax=Pseudomaricurvus hydrocarbonicus TaxID=1470433 RepID=A0A9E5MMR8_9GAMM|nr:pyrroloquinoline quinone-dependent dehydrogenase [Aestuariicella hydrocarbonica]NHO67086.1 pyrroloquinoline quinone-dependent dehydrogenase [Aestuariicella hydrocarbonica]